MQSSSIVTGTTDSGASMIHLAPPVVGCGQPRLPTTIEVDSGFPVRGQDSPEDRVFKGDVRSAGESPEPAGGLLSYGQAAASCGVSTTAAGACSAGGTLATGAGVSTVPDSSFVTAGLGIAMGMKMERTYARSK